MEEVLEALWMKLEAAGGFRGACKISVRLASHEEMQAKARRYPPG